MILTSVLRTVHSVRGDTRSSWRYSLAVLLSLAIGFGHATARADLIYEEVRVRQVAGSEGEAISRALVEAIGRVNGKTMSASQAASSAVAQVGRSSQTASSFQTSVRQSTMGVVNRYELLRSAENTRGWEVELMVEVAKLQKSDGKITMTLLPVLSRSEFKSDVEMLKRSLTSLLVGSRKW